MLAFHIMSDEFGAEPAEKRVKAESPCGCCHSYCSSPSAVFSVLLAFESKRERLKTIELDKSIIRIKNMATRYFEILIVPPQRISNQSRVNANLNSYPKHYCFC